ncbi:MAG: ATPase, T2SS/T4P/T4SS family [Candidatus Eremiobacterota bacterium]
MSLESELNQTLSRLTAAVEALAEKTSGPRLGFNLDQLLAVMIKHRGTFLHLNGGAYPMLRIAHELVPVGDRTITPKECQALLSSVLSREHLQSLSSGLEVGFGYAVDGAGFRFHVYQERGLLGASIRRIRTDIPPLEQLGLSGSVLERLLDARQGLIMLAGRPRCGKINTFAALISHLNQHQRVRLVTLESPIQFWHENKTAVVVQREVGVDTESFVHGVRQAVLQDPDILAVGELPDRETVDIVVQAAAGGHLVLAMMDAPSSIRAVDQIVEAFCSTNDTRMLRQFARQLKLMVCQHLVPRADGRGKLPVFEILECTDEVTDLIGRGETGSLHQVMRAEGMQTLARHLSRMVDVGMVAREEAVKLLDDPSELEVGEEPRYAPPPTPSILMDDDAPLMNWL